jgi:hypothetical protein
MTAAESKARETKECGLCKCTIERGKLDNYHWNKNSGISPSLKAATEAFHESMKNHRK